MNSFSYVDAVEYISVYLRRCILEANVHVGTRGASAPYFCQHLSMMDGFFFLLMYTMLLEENPYFGKMFLNFNQEHLYPKLKGYRDNAEINCKQ
jgi:hypothetical protein